jgi:hypothetical protein
MGVCSSTQLGVFALGLPWYSAPKEEKWTPVFPFLSLIPFSRIVKNIASR